MMLKFLRDIFGGQSKPNIDVLMDRPMKFQDGQDFFNIQCLIGNIAIKPGVGVAAIVVEPGIGELAKVNADGIQILTVRVADRDGGFEVTTETKGKGLPLKHGDVVIWVPMRFSEDAAKLFGDRRCGWLGLVFAKVNPHVPITNQEFDLECEYK